MFGPEVSPCVRFTHLVETRVAWLKILTTSSRPSEASGEISCYLYLVDMVKVSSSPLKLRYFYKQNPKSQPEPVLSWFRGFSVRSFHSLSRNKGGVVENSHHLVSTERSERRDLLLSLSCRYGKGVKLSFKAKIFLQTKPQVPTRANPNLVQRFLRAFVSLT